jgi:hypothetical protein
MPENVKIVIIILHIKILILYSYRTFIEHQIHFDVALTFININL